jgi:hypothetical protein
VPPELFEGEQTLVLHTIRYWDCNWMIALENNYDAHNCFYVHRNSLVMLRSRSGGRPRTPLGYRSKVVNNRAVLAMPGAEQHYAKDGRLPYQLYYPRVQGHWPLHRRRLLWTWLFELFDRLNRSRPRFDTPEEWQGLRLPSILRLFFGGPEAMYTRWCVPVEENLTRVVYFRSMRLKTMLGRLYERLTYRLYRDWLFHYNFSDQDYDAMRSTRYQYPEDLSLTDSVMVTFRRVVTTQARGRKGPEEQAELTKAEKVLQEAPVSKQDPSVVTKPALPFIPT